MRCEDSFSKVGVHSSTHTPLTAHTPQLSPQDPYAHYRHPGTSCFERLFDQEEIDRFERETAMGVAGMGGVDGLPFVDGDEWREVRGIWEW